MRRWILIFMIALLPVRGWVGDVMAGEMAGAQLVAMNLIATHADSTGAAAELAPHSGATSHADCHGGTGMADRAGAFTPAAPTSAHHASQDGDTCGSCAACQACHTLALAAPPSASAPVPPHHSTPPSLGKPFASAVPARGFKPPIS